ncbi:MAG TPA: metallophosphoesterase family protein [Candidatus Obscuribacterales bacterium]
MRIAVLADTHIPKRARSLPEAAWKIIRSADAIIHAGDVLSPDFLHELEALAPLYAVRGNNDLTLQQLPETLEVDLAGASIALIHDSGDKKGRATRLRRRFPNADVVVFGHSHIPMNELVDGQILFNPGSPTDRRTQPHFTMGILKITDGKVLPEIIVVDS